MFSFIYLIIVFPLLGLLTNILVGRYLGERWAGIVASLASGGAFVIAVLMAIALVGNDFQAAIVGQTTWLQVGELEITWAFQIDTLSVTMMLLVTGVGTLIHIYAIGYMHGDENVPRFFVYMNLFIIAMLLLVSGNNYLMLFIGWEGVGLCSYLLIGFWFDQGEDSVGNASAARKAFVVNRIGDFGMLLAIFMLFWTTGSLVFDEVFHAAESGEIIATTATVITLLMLLGVAGKSAQIPLYIWLPDAMAGPTPVSALIHAATMVTAGIYLITRSAPLFDLAPGSQMVVAVVGATTAFWAGGIAMAQYDIKRVLAFSTISQLGFMVAAVGLGGYVAAMFHLLTHAFFKALLFLSSGSVIHGMEHGHQHLAHEGHGGGEDGHDDFDPQDMRTMGGLKDKMPTTFIVYVIGSLALAGVIPFAGFWSKDEILADAFHVGTEGYAYGWAVYALLTVAAIFTAFYMGRQVFLTFYGKPRHAAAEHARESPRVMTVPLIILAILATLGGLMNLPGVHTLGSWLEETSHFFETGDFNITVALISTVLALGAIAAAYAIYGRTPLDDADAPDPLSRTLGPLWVAIENKLYIDELYRLIIIRPFEWLAEFLGNTVDWKFWHDFVHDSLIAGTFKFGALLIAEPVDKGVVDGFFDGLGSLIRGIARQFRRVQSGYVRNYALGILLGTVLLLGYFLFMQ